MKKILDNKVQVETILLQPAVIFIILASLKRQGDFSQLVTTQIINPQGVAKILDQRGTQESTSPRDKGYGLQPLLI